MEEARSLSNGGQLLLSFPVDILDQISRFLIGNEVLNLLMTGNRALMQRLRNISTLSVSWSCSRYTDWNDCLPLIRLFSRLRVLTLKTSPPLHRCLSSLEVGKLPSNLSSLSLHYSDSLALLTKGEPFLGMHSLTFLSLSHTATIFNSASNCSIRLDQFPPSLLHLIISEKTSNPSFGVGHYFYYLADMDLLPPELITFDVNIVALMDTRREKLVPKEQPFLLSSLKHLGISVFGMHMPLDHVRNELRSLRIYGGDVCFGGKSFADLRSDHGAAIRTLLPHLHTFILEGTLNASLEMIESLPSTVTRFGGNMEYTLPENDAVELLRGLNRAYQQALHLTDRPGAPMMIRSLEIRNVENQLKHVLPFFSSLERLNTHGYQPIPELEKMPPKLRGSLNADTLIGPPERLPRSLTSVACQTWDLELYVPKEESLMASVAATMPALVTLNLDDTYLSKAMIPLLPKTLERFKVCVADQDILEALATRANFESLLPNLNDLSLRLGHVKVSLDQLPSSIASLELAGLYTLSDGLSRASLAHHPRLTSLKMEKAMPSKEVLPHLSKRLLHAYFAISTEIDLNDPETVEMMYGLPPDLRTLHISPQIVANGKTWFAPASRSVIQPLTVLANARSSAETRFRLAKMLPPVFISKSLLFLVAETYMLSLLPRRITDFSAPFEYSHSIIYLDLDETFFQTLVETCWVENGEPTMLHVFVTRLPLLGLFFPEQFRPSTKGLAVRRIDIYLGYRLRNLLPRLSNFEPRFIALRNAYASYRSGRPVGYSDQEDVAVFQFLGRMAAHTVNLTVWISLHYYLQLDRATQPIAWSLEWVNLVGSAAAIPLHLVAQRRLIPALRNFAGLKDLLQLLGLSSIFLWIVLLITNYSTAVLFGFSGSNWSFAARLPALLFMFIGELILHFASRRLF